MYAWSCGSISTYSFPLESFTSCPFIISVSGLAGGFGFAAVAAAGAPAAAAYYACAAAAAYAYAAVAYYA